jgi:hypothetical protein
MGPPMLRCAGAFNCAISNNHLGSTICSTQPQQPSQISNKIKMLSLEMSEIFNYGDSTETSIFYQTYNFHSSTHGFLDYSTMWHSFQYFYHLHMGIICTFCNTAKQMFSILASAGNNILWKVESYCTHQLLFITLWWVLSGVKQCEVLHVKQNHTKNRVKGMLSLSPSHEGIQGKQRYGYTHL